MSFQSTVAEVKKNNSSLATSTTNDLLNELKKRELNGETVFPLDIFHKKLRPFINDCHENMDIPRSFIGLSMLMAQSTAIGNAYQVYRSRDGEPMPVSIWGCMQGMSSSGKSLCYKTTLKPIAKIHDMLDQQFSEQSESLTDWQLEKLPMKQLLVKDVVVPTLIRGVLPHNPKGLMKDHDELLEFILSMNKLSNKEGADEQFFLSSWNGTRYTAIRSGNKKFTIKRPFINVFGGIQPMVLYKLFANERGTTGFIYRVLFASVEEQRIADPKFGHSIPKEYYEIHEKCINCLFYGLPYESYDDELLKEVHFTTESQLVLQEWHKYKLNYINNEIKDMEEKNTHAGIYGKIKEYIYRIAAILQIVDYTLDQDLPYDRINYPNMLYVQPDTMKRAIQAGEYFYHSAYHVYSIAHKTMFAPQEVLVLARLFSQGKSVSQIADVMYGDKKYKAKAQRALQKAIKEYPLQFAAKAK